MCCMKLGYIIIYVSDVPKTVAFYETAFDLKRRFIHESHLYAEMETSSTALAFAGNEAAEMAGLSLLPNDPRTVAAGWEICLITDDVAKALSGWIAGRIPATRGERSRMLLGRLMPELLRQLAKGTQPDSAFAALAYFIEGLPSSVQIFSLLDYNRHLAQLLCDIIVLSPRLTQILKRNPMLFELLLYKEFFDPLPDTETIASQMREIIAGQAVEDALDNIKRYTRELRFRAELQAISLSSDRSALEKSLSAIAEATMQVVLELARADMERRHGKIAGICGIIALGRLGIGEEGSVIGRGVHPHPEDLPVLAKRHLPLEVDVASESSRDQVAGLVLDPFDRTFGEDRRQDRNDVAGVHRDLVTETTAEVGADDPDLMLRQLRHHGHRRSNDVRGLRGHVHGQLARCTIVVRYRAAPL